MKPAQHSAVNAEATQGLRSCARRPWAALLVVALVTSLQVLLPSAAHAHDYGPPGVGGAQITIDPDGYNSGFFFGGREYRVTGKGFNGPDVAQIFQCAVGAKDLHKECQLLETALIDPSGALPPTDVFMTDYFSNTEDPAPGPSGQAGLGVHCLDIVGVQCSVVVATFGPDLQPTSKAEHFICFEGSDPANNCKPRPTTSLRVDHVSILEGDSGTKNANFEVTLSAPMPSPVTVNYATTADTATAGSDYTTTSGTLTVAAGTTTATISVPVKADTTAEADERFFMDLSNLSDGTGFAHPRAVATIVSDDPAPATLSVGDASVTEGSAGTTTQAIFSVSLSEAYPTAFTVRAVTAEYTAHPLPHESNDYVHLNQVLSFAPGEISKPVAVTVNGDNIDERDETFTLALEESTGPQRAKRQGVGVITNDDGLPTMSIDDVSMAEGNAGPTEARFTVSLGQSSFREVKVDYATIDGSARSTNHAVFGPADYSPVAGTLIFAPGETTKSVVVVVNGDTLKEQDEEFALNLSNNINATTTKRTGVGTVRDDDGLVADPDDPTVTIHDVALNEGRFTGCGQNGNPPCQLTPTEFPFRIELSKASSRAITVNYATADGTARSTNHATFGAADYTPASGSVTFAPGETEKTVVVLVNPDDVKEPMYLAGLPSEPAIVWLNLRVLLAMNGGYDEHFFVQLTSAVNANPAKRVATGAIRNDDWA